MLDELVRRISEKTGLPEEQARLAAEAAIGFVKEKLPAPMPDRSTAISAAAAKEADMKAAAI